MKNLILFHFFFLTQLSIVFVEFQSYDMSILNGINNDSFRRTRKQQRIFYIFKLKTKTIDLPRSAPGSEWNDVNNCKRDKLYFTTLDGKTSSSFVIDSSTGIIGPLINTLKSKPPRFLSPLTLGLSIFSHSTQLKIFRSFVSYCFLKCF